MINLTEYSWYYCKMKDGDIQMLERGDDYFLSGDVPLLNNEVKQVLGKVPSFEEWKSSDKLILTLMDNIKDKSDLLQLAMIKNVELKEVLKECKALLSCLQIDDYDGNGLLVLNKINQVLGE